MSNRSTLAVLLLAVVFLACGEETMNSEQASVNAAPAVVAAAFEKVAPKKVFWGHQSVGFNILDGMEKLAQDAGAANLTVLRSSDPADFKGGGALLHDTVGGNLDPVTKIEDFVSAIEGGMGGEADYAILKLCYLDFNAQTDSKAIFANYRDAVDRLSDAYPSTRIVHFTVPIFRKQTGPKALVKRLLGKPLAGFEDNRRRNEYNELLKTTYRGKAPIFDLATIESTHVDGRRETGTAGGETFPALVPAFTDDGGHLNETGRRIVAEKLILFLAELD